MITFLLFACLIGITGKPIFCEKWDLAKGEKILLPGLPPNLFSRIKNLSTFPPTGGDLSRIKISGFYKEGRELLMLSARPVITSDNQGPVRGTIVLGRSLDAGVVAQLQKQVEVVFSVISLEDPDLTEEERELSSGLIPEIIHIVEQNHTQTLRGYSLLPDMGGGLGFLIRAELPRHILEKGRTTFAYSLAMISVLGLLMVILVLVLLKKIIVSPITAVTKHALDELKTIIESSQVGIMVLKGDRILYKGNQRLADILGYDSPESMMGLSMSQIHISQESFIRFGEKYFNCLVHGEQIQVEYQLQRRDKTPVWCTLSGKAIDPCIPPDLSKGVLWMLDDITEKKEYQEKLKEMATRDFLTGLFNRRYFMTLGEIELKRQMRYPHCGLTLIMLDIDHFKKINDDHGHDIGDLVLQHFTRIGQKHLRDVDIFARIGGEEFVILLPSTDLEGSYATAERLRQAIEKSFVNTDKGKIMVTVSLGLSTWTRDIKEIRTMLTHADHALYAAKHNGRNRVECYTKALRQCLPNG